MRESQPNQLNSDSPASFVSLAHSPAQSNVSAAKTQAVRASVTERYVPVMQVSIQPEPVTFAMLGEMLMDGIGNLIFRGCYDIYFTCDHNYSTSLLGQFSCNIGHGFDGIRIFCADSISCTYVHTGTMKGSSRYSTYFGAIALNDSRFTFFIKRFASSIRKELHVIPTRSITEALFPFSVLFILLMAFPARNMDSALACGDFQD